jgi:hypothetical protein
MYLHYVKERVAVLGLLLAMVAVVVAATKDDLIYGLDLVSVGFLVGWPLQQSHVWWNRRDHPEWKTQFGLQLVVLTLGVAYTVGLYAASFHKTANAFAGVGAVIGALQIAWFVFVHVPQVEKSVKSCPECVGRVDVDARVCPSCNYRWQPPL